MNAEPRQYFPDDALSPKEAAAYLKVSLRTVYRLGLPFTAITPKTQRIMFKTLVQHIEKGAAA